MILQLVLFELLPLAIFKVLILRPPLFETSESDDSDQELTIFLNMMLSSENFSHFKDLPGDMPLFVAAHFKICMHMGASKFILHFRVVPIRNYMPSTIVYVYCYKTALILFRTYFVKAQTVTISIFNINRQSLMVSDNSYQYSLQTRVPTVIY